MTAVSLVLLEHDSNDNSTVAIREHKVEGYSYSPMGTVHGILSNAEVKEQPLGAVAEMAAACALCNDAKIIGLDQNEKSKQDDDETSTLSAITSVTRKKKKKLQDTEKTYQRVGEPTEAALCVLAEKPHIGFASSMPSGA